MSRFVLGTIGCTLMLTAVAAEAAVTSYPEFAPSFSHVSPGGENPDYNTSSPTITLNAATGQFVDPDSGSPDPTRTRYMGGTLSLSRSQSSPWSAGIRLDILRSTGSNGVYVSGGNGASNWRFNGDASDHTSLIPSSEGLNFVLKVVDGGWNQASVDVYYGAKAIAETEGTPDATLTLTNANASNFLRDARVSFTAAGWASGQSSGSLSNFFTADTWTAVSVPEPASLGVVGFAGLLALRRRRSC